MADPGGLLVNAGAYPGEIGPAAAGGEFDFSQGENAQGKVSLFEFVTHNHSLLAIWFATQEEAPPVLLPCICCTGPNVTQGITRRARIFIFSFVIVSILIITLQVSNKGWEPSWLYVWLQTVCIILPLSCHLKSTLPRYSDWLAAKLPPIVPQAKHEEIMLVLSLLLAIIYFAASGGVESTGEVVGDFFSSMAAMMTAEVVSLVYKYTFCALCCPCCLSEGVGNYREPNKATIMV